MKILILLFIFQLVLVQFGNVQSMFNCRFAKASFICNSILRLAQIKHHLESLRLLPHRQIFTLHIFFQHDRNLLFFGYLANNLARNLLNTCQFGCCQSSVPNYHMKITGQRFCISVRLFLQFFCQGRQRNYGQILHNALLLD